MPKFVIPAFRLSSLLPKLMGTLSDLVFGRFGHGAFLPVKHGPVLRGLRKVQRGAVQATLSGSQTTLPIGQSSGERLVPLSPFLAIVGRRPRRLYSGFLALT